MRKTTQVVASFPSSAPMPPPKKIVEFARIHLKTFALTAETSSHVIEIKTNALLDLRGNFYIFKSLTRSLVDRPSFN